MSVYSLFCSFSSWTVLVAHQIMPDATKASGEMDQCRVEVSHTCRNHISALPISTLLAHTAHSKPSRQSNTHHTTLKKKSALFVQITYKNKHDGGEKNTSWLKPQVKLTLKRLLCCSLILIESAGSTLFCSSEIQPCLDSHQMTPWGLQLLHLWCFNFFFPFSLCSLALTEIYQI